MTDQSVALPRSKRQVVVFGGAGALGSAVVGRIVSDGYPVVAADVTIPDGERRLPSVEYRTVDAASEESVAEVIDQVGEDFWGIVNVIGGYTPPQPMGELEIAVLKQQLELNLVTAAIVTKHALSRLAASGRGGRVIHTSSRAAIGDGARTFAYSVSKLAVIRLVESAAAEVRELGITVNCILPSVIDTPANRAAMPNSNHDRWPKPDQLASVISFLVSDEAGIVSGGAIPVYGLA
jgi:NAD(P)-dependent dehydrogenase (short-subunit alcohol dehydrogenase family)